MITEWIMNLGIGIAEWFISLFGTEPPPEWISSITTWLGQLMGSVSGLGAWLPWGIAITVAGVVLALWLAGFVIKGLRWVLGLIPTMGGG